MIRNRLFEFLADSAGSRRGVLFLVIAGALSLVSLALVPRLPILTAREGLVDKHLPAQRRYMALLDEFGAMNQLLVLLQGDPAGTRAAADAVAAALAKNPQWVKNVFYRIDLDPFKRSGLYYVPLDDLRKMSDGLSGHEDLLKKGFASGTWLGVLKAVEEQTSSIQLGSIRDERKVADAFDRADRFLAQWLEYLRNPAAAKFDAGGAAFGDLVAQRSESFADKDGYLASDLGRIHVLLVQQSRSIDDAEYTLPFMKYCRKTVADVLKSHPGVTAGFTGWPASIEEEMGMVQNDLRKLTILSTIMILAIFYAGFRSVHRTILVFVPLSLGILWNLGLTLFTVGHLNYLTSVFAGVLLGIGIDQGVVLIRRFDEERAAGAPPRDAIRATLHSEGPPVMLGACTTITAFLAIGATDQPAFAELGKVAGTGILCVMISTFFILPVLLTRFPPRMSPGDESRRAESALLRRFSTWLLQFSIPLIVVWAVALVVLASQIPKVGFDYNLNNLLPSDSETVRVGAILDEKTPYQVQSIALVADNLDQVRRLHPMLASLPTVRRVESAATLIPPDQDEKRKLFSAIARRIDGLAVKASGAPPDVQALSSRVESISHRIQTAQEDAFTSGRASLVQHLDKLIGRFSQIRKELSSPDASTREARFEADLFAAAQTAKGKIIEMLNAPPVTLASVDPSLRERLVGKTGRLVTYVFPKEKIWDKPFLNKFVDEVSGVAARVFGEDQAVERVSGFGVVFRTTTEMIRHGFTVASWMAGGIVLVMVLLDLRSPKYVLLTTLPLVTAAVAAIGGLGLLGKDLNMASQLSLPILLGYGMDFGIYFVRRWMEPDGRDLPRVVSTIGASIIIAGGTTVAGFGSLIFARHLGLIAFGEVQIIAISICLLAAVFGLPVIIKGLRLDRRSR